MKKSVIALTLLTIGCGGKPPSAAAKATRPPASGNDAASCAADLKATGRRLEVVKQDAPKDWYDVAAADSFEGELAIQFRVARAGDRPPLTFRYLLRDNGDEITARVSSSSKGDAVAGNPAPRVELGVDGESAAVQTAPGGSDDHAWFVPLSLLRRIGSAKAATLTGRNPDCEYTLTEQDQRAASRLASLIEKVRSVK